MILFDKIERCNHRTKWNAEPHFHYLNYSARPEAAKTRNLLEQWFSHYPNEHRNSLQGNFRSFNNYNHFSAVFELFLHELLLRLQCHVEIHPTLPYTTRKPDFLVTDVNGSSFYLEAILATGESKDKAGERARIFRIYDKINEKVKSEDFFICLWVRNSSRNSPRIKEIVSFVKTKLDEVDYHKFEKANERPMWTWVGDGWLIDFYPFKKSKNVEDKNNDRIIGFSTEGVQLSNLKIAIRKAVVGKAGRYGDLKLPYVIAVNAMGWSVDSQDIMDALYGDEQAIVEFMEFVPVKQKCIRLTNGAWTSKSGPRYTRNSAVLLTRRLDCWKIEGRDIRLYHNPWTKKPYKSVLNSLPQAVLQDNTIKMIDGKSLGKIFGLPSGWPEN